PCLSPYFDAALQGAAQRYLTFHHTNGRNSARLDHVFASCHLAECSFSTTLVDSPLSNQKARCGKLVPLAFTKPPIGRWNTGLLNRQDLRDSTENKLLDADGNWDVFKTFARSTAKDFAVAASHERNRESRRLQRQLAQAERLAKANQRSVYADPTAISARLALRTHLDAAATRAILRARVQWLEEGERCSYYFFLRFRNSRTTARLSLLRDANGQEFGTTAARTDHVRSFYSRLYAAPTHDSTACHSFLRPLTLPQVGPGDILHLSATISAEELEMVVRKLPLRKSPGPDGLPYEWYRTYLPFLSPVLLDLYNGILQGDAPPMSWSATTLTLIPKPGRQHSELRNWRPITLANCDAKIFSRILANRLATT